MTELIEAVREIGDFVEKVQPTAGTMKANVFHGKGDFRLESKAIPNAGNGDAVVRVRLTTICGTDIHIVSSGNVVHGTTPVGFHPCASPYQTDAASTCDTLENTLVTLENTLVTLENTLVKSRGLDAGVGA